MKNVLLTIFEWLCKNVFFTWSFWVLCFPAIFAYLIGNIMDAQAFFLLYILWKLRVLQAIVVMFGFASLFN